MKYDLFDRKYNKQYYCKVLLQFKIDDLFEYILKCDLFLFSFECMLTLYLLLYNGCLISFFGRNIWDSWNLNDS